MQKSRSRKESIETGAGTVGDLLKDYEDKTRKLHGLKPSSITSRITALKKVKKTWPELETMKPSKVTPRAVEEWATRFKRDGTKYTPPGAKTIITGNSATSVNRAIDTLRRVMDLAIEYGAIHTNPVTVKPSEGRLKKKIVQTKLNLPKFSDVQRLFTAIESNGAVGGWAAEAADFCRFLAYSGCRVGEVSTVTWECVDNEKKHLLVHGEKTATSDRIVPLFSDLAALLEKVRERRKKAAIYSTDGKPTLEPKDRLFRLSEAQKSINRACETLGIERITHHDFRHLFATRCIESGVDIPTVSRWLGHSDGGALAMKTYGHLRQEHSASMAAKVSFGGSS